MQSKRAIMYILAEYCAAQFYMGWWLYERETNDGRANQHGLHDNWGWMRDGSSWSKQQDAAELCQRMGHEPPPVRRHGQDFAEWFAATFPYGLRVQVADYDDEWEGYILIEQLTTRPRQRRGVIRTIRRAAMVDRRLEKSDVK